MAGGTQPTLAQLVAQIAALLPAATPTSLTAGSAGNDAYEAYGFAVALAAASDVGLSIAWESTSGTPFTPSVATPVTLRTSPSALTSGAFSHAVLDWDGDERFELHTGVYVDGASGVEHERDVVLLDRAGAQRARAAAATPEHDAALLSMEAKFYASTSAAGVSVGREFRGLCSDLGSSMSHWYCETELALLYVTHATQSLHSLLAGRYVQCLYEGIAPGNAVEDALRERWRRVYWRALAGR